MDLNNLIIKLKDRLSPKLFNHCIGTMEEAEKLSLRYSVDVNKAKTAGLLHDCGKSEKGKDNLTHAETGAILAKEVYNVQDEDIINAIKHHTTGREDMTTLEKIIYIADKIEPNRHYDGVEELRRISYEDLDAAIILSIENTIEYVKNMNMVLDHQSLNTLNFLKEKR
ncbi:bis(5'-nucleosyl)-tetraphosphatase (symmetrical) YqeK [Sedimentibacter hydroxybenzoicus DSM 7310]|uniref:bis(5'-nucleosyl)-tetraphosphatase (symmetrical) n=1 Tax=Sedimentibacter hydroxybenzoicus DSM 7310 TaxID=1123245 RepID=A0A974BIW9_SEDHY|nr:bis(5'-nucleosyl)-tetraphosphatase (symmetrical) YqeK [Sedimentibacter hydroxybenzoicus]NYB74029.1 bis(5'-nucleosyl)-tetraphosphatase (symmetrical) YqeK [Sedimentibacter hydroxybenzoicus DSM 7310]